MHQEHASGLRAVVVLPCISVYPVNLKTHEYDTDNVWAFLNIGARARAAPKIQAYEIGLMFDLEAPLTYHGSLFLLPTIIIIPSHCTSFCHVLFIQFNFNLFISH